MKIYVFINSNPKLFIYKSKSARGQEWKRARLQECKTREQESERRQKGKKDDPYSLHPHLTNKTLWSALSPLPISWEAQKFKVIIMYTIYVLTIYVLTVPNGKTPYWRTDGRNGWRMEEDLKYQRSWSESNISVIPEIVFCVLQENEYARSRLSGL